nr:serine protease [Gammaproteobacteria bacterium]
MLQNIYSRFRGASLMLLQKEQDTVTFVGTAVLVHPAGYLLTASHILYSHKNLMVAPSEVSEEFV